MSISARRERARAEGKAGRFFEKKAPTGRAWSREGAPVPLDDPKVCRQLLAVAAVYSRMRPELAPDFDGEVNYALYYASRRWRPGTGMGFRTYAVTVAKARCNRLMRAGSAPRGFRSPRHPDSLPPRPRVRSLDAVLFADPPADPAEPVADAVERSELVALALEAFGPDAADYWRWLAGEATSQDLAAELGISRSRIHQRWKKGLARARAAMAEIDP